MNSCRVPTALVAGESSQLLFFFSAGIGRSSASREMLDSIVGRGGSCLEGLNLGCISLVFDYPGE